MCRSDTGIVRRSANGYMIGLDRALSQKLLYGDTNWHAAAPDCNDHSGLEPTRKYPLGKAERINQQLVG